MNSYRVREMLSLCHQLLSESDEDLSDLVKSIETFDVRDTQVRDNELFNALCIRQRISKIHTDIQELAEEIEKGDK